MNPALLFRSLRARNFRLYFTGQFISLIGTWMQRVAIAWLVYRLTNSELMLGIVSFASLIPSLILSPYAGALADRHNRYNILFISQVASMLQSGAMAAMVLCGWYSMTGIIILSIAQGVINSFDTTSRQSLMVSLIDHKEDLPNAIALNSSMVNLARLLGPVVAGVLLTAWGEGVCFFVDFLSFVAVLISLLMMRLQLPPRKASKGSVWEGLRLGYQYLNEARDIKASILLLAVISMCVTPYNTLMPVFAKATFHGGKAVYSSLQTFVGAGALIMAIYMASLKPGRDVLRIENIMSAVFACAVLLFAFCHWLPLGLVLMIFSGAGMMGTISCTNTYVQTHVAENMRSRVISYYVMAFQGTIPIGALLVGWSAEYFGTAITLGIQGAIGLTAAALFALHVKKLKAMPAATAASIRA
ncbi:Predicted arabinose efflux permease, MFS family [Chitinophaga costaii]|uniref:Predicted arabinose efflux permease, MFS family n=1 Tax=Chitinophaga costaii TaxID=1335309 RepID=A0A1C4FCD3_9BACT|nr:MFS transporter [Chitinophaga costaii]PUZ20696.1 MFS transporter [Chitinophaga costaii]SCC53494.1 Predicted arabinose efflux permease, MFS family [Chitinophaga costaii]